MLNTFVFLNCNIGTEPAIVSELIGDIAGVSEAIQVPGVYDIVAARVSEESMKDIANLEKKIRAIANIRSDPTMIISEESMHAVKRMEVV
jgi:DNA-binding Lrp family transcriptional regulator